MYTVLGRVQCTVADNKTREIYCFRQNTYCYFVGFTFASDLSNKLPNLGLLTEQKTTILMNPVQRCAPYLKAGRIECFRMQYEFEEEQEGILHGALLSSRT